jgi:carbamoyl-phosphate synthase large subunit
MAVYPPVSLSPKVQAAMVTSACEIARALEVRGLMNIQFVIADEVVYVLEVNPRASRTVPYLSKVTGIPMVDLATRCMMGQTLRDLGYSSGLWVLGSEPTPMAEAEGGEAACMLAEVADQFGLVDPKKRKSWQSHAPGYIVPESAFRDGAPNLPRPGFYAIKAPVFSFQKLSRVEPSLGPEMKSTGEILGIDPTLEGALYKALVASGIHFRGEGSVLLSVKDEDKPQAVEIARKLHAANRKIMATPGTAQAIQAAGIPCQSVNKIRQGPPTILDAITQGKASLMINTPGLEETAESEAARIRRSCIESGIPCVTSIDTAQALIRALDVFADPSAAQCLRLEEYFSFGKA